MRHVNAIGMSWKTGHYISTLLYSEIYRAKKLSLVTEDRETSLGVCSPRERHPKDTPDNGTLTEYRDAVIRKMPPILTWHECVEAIPAGGYL